MLSMNENITLYDSEIRKIKVILQKSVILAVYLMLVACGSTPVSENFYSSVQVRIDDAKKIKADELAGAELYAAQKKFEDARRADKAGDREKALRLLKEAELHAQLAESRALSARSQKALDAINAGLNTLQEELDH
ncbi:protein of unknown function [Nitrosomonas cryotolerans]|uniref:DUF4398 domain-containing protein n=1 Tax=Nitrosomonas cryotolerans ATCC 49181 TaxID=1131553 RepID=A0A1N6IY58_9PROT|nr:DUF4398 domain-containing protein [Nitrosomonas cryotolerans]SFQ01786.1 protein of unknown function [Nitrosomonas cryotolerans]SIO37038.1 protein of unknown function [Nitrosomonas cryotolerans ATCC 49181]